MKISKIYTYPVKSLRETELDSSTLTKVGFTYDRRYMILKVEEDGTLKNMAVAYFPEMTTFFTAINIPEDGDARKGTITITYKPPTGEQRTLDIPLKANTAELEQIEVIMHRSPTNAYRMAHAYNAWFSSCFGYEVILAYLGDNLRKVRLSTWGNKQQTNGNGWLASITSKATEMVVGSGDQQKDITFADCAPYLVVSDKSMEDVQNRLPESEQMDITKFRPNIVVSGADEVWEEDYWAELTIGTGIRVECEHNCARCQSINIDYETGRPGKTETGSILKKLSSNNPAANM